MLQTLVEEWELLASGVFGELLAAQGLPKQQEAAERCAVQTGGNGFKLTTDGSRLGGESLPRSHPWRCLGLWMRP